MSKVIKMLRIKLGFWFIRTGWQIYDSGSTLCLGEEIEKGGVRYSIDYFKKRERIAELARRVKEQ